MTSGCALRWVRFHYKLNGYSNYTAFCTTELNLTKTQSFIDNKYKYRKFLIQRKMDSKENATK